ncbi:hypothetical protein Btru_061286 [Bulinus truncatus]|nr:hypothetical protein Btru_061286 [Bulinus truncatus]
MYAVAMVNNFIDSECICQVGHYRPTSGASCQVCDPSHYGQDCVSTCSCNFANTKVCNNTGGECQCNSGWTGANCDQDIDECKDPGYCSGDFVKCVNLNGSAQCLCADGYMKPTNSSTCQVCDSNHYGANCASVCTCQNSATCSNINGSCTCQNGWSGDDCGQPVAAPEKKDLIIGLSVGIPLFLILLAAVAIAVCLFLRRRRKRHSNTPTEDWEGPFRSIFATRMNTKGSWGSPSIYSPDGFSDAASSSGSMDGQLIKTSDSSKNSGFQDTTWNKSEATNRQGVGANFSWDYMFNILQNHKGFEIQRPIINPSPNPAFVQTAKDGDSQA